MIKQY